MGMHQVTANLQVVATPAEKPERLSTPLPSRVDSARRWTAGVTDGQPLFEVSRDVFGEVRERAHVFPAYGELDDPRISAVPPTVLPLTDVVSQPRLLR